MEDLRLRGYVTPEDMTGTDSERIRGALDLCAELDIGKVVLSGTYQIEGTFALSGMTEIVFRDAVIRSAGKRAVFTNKDALSETPSWSTADKYIYIKAEGASEIDADFVFANATDIVCEDLPVNGSLYFEFCREVRLERDHVRTENGPALTLARGCNNFIMQYNEFSGSPEAAAFDSSKAAFPYSVGNDAEIHECIFKDTRLSGPLGLQATAECGLFNLQIDHLTAPETVIRLGDGTDIDEARYFNLTAVELTSASGREPIELNAKTKHCCFA